MANINQTEWNGSRAGSGCAPLWLWGLAVLIAVGGFGCKSSSQASNNRAKGSKGPQIVAVMHLEPFVVNLADPEENRFLRVGIDLGLENPPSAKGNKEGEVPTARIRDCILTVLSTQFLPGTAQPPAKAHRVPLGLLMLSRGLADNEQLKKALKAQKDSGSGRLGEWLRHIGAVSEEQVTQILGLQWSIAVFPLNQSRRFLECAHLVPFPLLEAAEMLPVHYLPTSQHLYVAFVDRINYSALYAVEKMLECHTEPCLALQSQVLQALKELRSRPRPGEVLVDNLSDPAEMASAVLAHAVRQGATDVRISGFNGFIWARILSPPRYTDLLFQAPRNQPEIIFPPESGE